MSYPNEFRSNSQLYKKAKSFGQFFDYRSKFDKEYLQVYDNLALNTPTGPNPGQAINNSPSREYYRAQPCLKADEPCGPLGPSAADPCCGCCGTDDSGQGSTCQGDRGAGGVKGRGATESCQHCCGPNKPDSADPAGRPCDLGNSCCPNAWGACEGKNCELCSCPSNNQCLSYDHTQCYPEGPCGPGYYCPLWVKGDHVPATCKQCPDQFSLACDSYDKSTKCLSGYCLETRAIHIHTRVRHPTRCKPCANPADCPSGNSKPVPVVDVPAAQACPQTAPRVIGGRWRTRCPPLAKAANVAKDMLHPPNNIG